MYFFLFFLGAAFGSFLNVIVLRYAPEKFLLGGQILGRSHCPNCGTRLRWYELIPILSFVFLCGRCLACRARISVQYPLVEVISGMIFIFVPRVLISNYPITQLPNYQSLFISALWIVIFEALLLLSLIDMRLMIIPNEASVFLLAAGVVLTFLSAPSFGLVEGSFIGQYASLFGFRGDIWTNRFAAAAFALAFFAFLIFITKGRGMGVGDLKLAGALGFVFGWPDIAVISMLAFVLGSLAGGYLMLAKKVTLKSHLPFGGFIALASAIVFFFGKDLLAFYFGLFWG